MSGEPLLHLFSSGTWPHQHPFVSFNNWMEIDSHIIILCKLLSLTHKNC